MKKVVLLFILAISLTFLQSAFAGSNVSLTATGGTLVGNYTTLGTAVNAINSGTHQGSIVITINNNLTEGVAIQLDSSGNGTGSSYTSILITSSGNWVVTGAFAGSFITYMGSDNVTINGVNSGGVSLTFNNTLNTGSTFKLINDATSNMFKNTTIKGTSVTTNAGVVWLSTAMNTGNDNNVFDACNFDGTFAAFSLLTSNGTATSSFIENSGDTVRNCKFYDNNPTAGASPVAMWLINGTDWYVKNNSFYFTAPITLVAQGVYSSIIAYPNWTTDQHNIDGNFIGGSGPNCTGTMTINGSGANIAGFNGMYIQTGGTLNIIQNNTVKNVVLNVAGAAGSFTNWGIGTYIGGYNGTMTLSGNTISDMTLTNTLGNMVFIGMSNEGRTVASGTITPVYTVSNNIVNNITSIGGGGGTAAQCTGYRALTSSAASLTVAAISNPTFIVSGNTVSNLTANFVAASTLARGIVSANTVGTVASPLRPRLIVTANTIFNLTANGILASYTGPEAGGIYLPGLNASGSATDTTQVIGNTIYGLNATNATDVGTVAEGILLANGRYTVSKNKMYGFTNASTGVATRPGMVGINFIGLINSASEISNNYIALGEGQTSNTQIFGIMNNATTAIAMNIYYNSIFISGTGAGGNTRNAICVYRGTEAFVATTTPFNLLNNLLVMSRTGGTGSYYAIGTAGTGTWTSNYNALISSSASTIALWNNLPNDFNTYKTNSAGAASSVSLITGVTSDYTVTPSVLNPADLFNNATPGLTGILDIKTTNQAAWIVNGKGTAISTISTGYNGNTRSTTTGTATDIGANEITPSSTPPSMVESGSFSNGGTTTYGSFGRTVMSILWNNVGTIATRTSGFYPGTTPPGTLDPVGRYSNGYWQMDVNGGASGYNYDITLMFDPSMTGNTVNDANMKIGKRTTPAGDWNLVTSTNNLDNTITAPGLTAFSQFALSDINFPLPVELSSFNANVDKNKVNLSWSTVSELNNSGFDIERKVVGATQWNRVGNVTGSGTSTTVKNYSFLENNIATGKYNYRLKQIDFNGNFHYYDLSSEVNVGVPTKFALSQNYPNPFNPTTNINYDLPFDSKVSIKIFDITGREITSLVNQLQTAGYHTINFNASNLSSGAYFYTITADGGSQNFAKTLKMVLIK